MNDRLDSLDGPFECVEAELGAQIALLADPALDAGLRKRLDDHLLICDACRLEMAVQTRVAAGLADGRLSLDSAAAPHATTRARVRFVPRILTWGGGLAVAASLLLMFLLPPVPSGPDVLRRSDQGGPQFLRPVEGEIVSTATPELEWTRIEGATAYRVQISRIGDEAIWSARVKTTTVRVPESFPLSGPARYRAILEPVPADLAGLADVSVTFRREGTAPFLAYRVGAAPLVARWLGIAGLAALAWGAAAMVPRKRPQTA